MTPENRNSPLIDNGSLTRYYGDADSWRPTWYGTRLSCQRNQQTFPWLPLDYKSGSAEKIDSIVVQSEESSEFSCGVLTSGQLKLKE
jgi:hypothetical protein